MDYRRIVLSCLTAVAALAPARAIVYHVRAFPSGPSDGLTWETAFRTIQPALDAAQPGDEVWVAGSREPENLVIYTPGVALLGGFSGSETSKDKRPSGYPTRLTVQTPAAAITLTPLAAAATVEGFSIDRRDRAIGPGLVCFAMGVTIRECTFRNCGAVSGDVGGIGFGPGTSGTVENCLIEDCWSANGGGILTRNASIKVLDCRIRSNQAMYSLTSSPDYYQMAWGGGICVIGGSAVIRGNDILGNVARHGGGIWADLADVTISHNYVTRNTAYRDSPLTYQTTVQTFGGGIGLSGCTSVVANNVIAENEAFAVGYTALGSRGDAWGGGLFVVGGGETTVRNNTIVSNLASAVGASDSHMATAGTAGGAAVLNGGMVMNCIFSGNRAVCGPGGRASDGALSAWGVGTGTYNLFDSNVPEDLYPGSSPSQPGSFSADPRFLPGTPAYRIGADSPAADAGNVWDIPWSEKDLGGAQRVQGVRVDLGAYEATAPPAPPRVYVSAEGSDTAVGTTWATAKQSLKAAVQTVAPDGEVWVREGTYIAGPVPASRITVRGGFRGDETAIEQRQSWTHPSIVGAAVVPETAFGAALDGLTVRPAVMTDLGSTVGIYVRGPGAIISRCVCEHVRVNSWGPSVAWAAATGILADTGPVTIRDCIVRDIHTAATSGGQPWFITGAYADATGIKLAAVDATVVGNIVVGMRSEAAGFEPTVATGGGIVANGTTGILANNTISDNTGDPTPPPYTGMAGIVVSGATADLVLANNIVALNSSGINLTSGSGTLTSRSNDVYGNGGKDYVGLTPGPTDTAADPLFANPAAGDYHLQPLSPCIDAGDDTYAFGPTDLDGRPRIAGFHVDLGCYEASIGGPCTVGDAASALRIAAGLGSATGGVFTRLNVDQPTVQRLDLADAVRILRKVNGLE